jgi:hypothetical protein
MPDPHSHHSSKASVRVCHGAGFEFTVVARNHCQDQRKIARIEQGGGQPGVEWFLPCKPSANGLMSDQLTITLVADHCLKMTTRFA